MRRPSQYGARLDRLIAQVETWSYGDSDAGRGLAQEIAVGLSALVRSAPSPRLRQPLRRAQDALDDGLSAEAIAAALYEARRELRALSPQGSRPPSPSP